MPRRDATRKTNARDFEIQIKKNNLQYYQPNKDNVKCQETSLFYFLIGVLTDHR